MNGQTAPPLVLLPPQLDPLDWAVRSLLQAHRTQLPDLASVTLILPGPAQAQRLRRLLAQHTGRVLLGPEITTLSGFAARGRSGGTLPALECELLLANALRQHPGARRGYDAWTLAESLFRLFEELSANTPDLAFDEARFLARIERGYGARALAQATQEARFVHTLWQAYLRDTGNRSPAVAEAQALRAAFDGLLPGASVWLIGFDALPADACAVLRDALTKRDVRILLQGPCAGHGAAASLALAQRLGTPAVIADEAPDRYAAAFGTATAAATPDARHIRIGIATHPEHEARMVDLAVRQALLDGADDIAVVTEDRRLARRLRALLERAGVPLRDEVGWALSTSSAAASLGHWLDCYEGNFGYRALLDLLKSGFYGLADDAGLEALEAAIHSRQIAGGLERLRQIGGAPAALLEPLARAARSLPSPSAAPRNGADWSQALLHSLQALPLWNAWQDDAAGAALRQQIEELHAALLRQRTPLDWSGFRRLLERRLENATFLPRSIDSPVRLLTLEQARGLRCQRLILAGASAATFPGRPEAQGLFNQAVRAELGLPHWSEHWQRQLGRFRTLLHAAPELLMTYAPEQEGEEAIPCPWIEALRDAGHTADDPALAALALRADCEIAGDDPGPLPACLPAPRPPTPAALLPASLSASAHQSLIDCPYRFFAGSLLGLRAWEDPDQPQDRSDYGERVHHILHAFFEQQPNLPPPFAGPVSATRRVEAAETLDALAQAVLASDLRSRALARLWLAEFRARIPDLVDWMIERAARWTQIGGEKDLERPLAGVQLKGRIDRLERDVTGAQGVVDYKTGAAPVAADVAHGEAVQATHYALLIESCSTVEYLRLGRDDETPVVIEGEALAQARDGVRARLTQLLAALRAGAALPAQGDDTTCSRCDYAGLCRQGSWRE
ncbi:MAG: PD-(D/E)XK nuclease family protein [Nevskiaceae bacterium]|nr:MAG: PD-(D/E)XK nuclease family protein [Nevskiaceae bacterium]